MRTAGHLRFITSTGSSSTHFGRFAQFPGDQGDRFVARVNRVLLRAVTDIVPVASWLSEIGLSAPAAVARLDAFPAGRFSRAGQLG